MKDTALTAQTHISRASVHEKAAAALGDNEWAAVAYFYSGYHLARCALLEDAIFDDVTRLHKKHLDLNHGDRYTSRHKGRKNSSAGREWGVNELVLLLYPQIAGAYERLHQASIDVRYGSGLRATVADVRACLTKIQDAHRRGELKARDV